MVKILLVVIVVALLATSGTCAALTDEEELGKLLYFDTDLSTPTGQSCSSCHDPEAGFADPDSELPVSQGVLPQNRFGNRNSPTAAYAAFSPGFGTITDEDGKTLYVGGQFWDGRANDLVEQAKGPFLNPLEMNNPSKLAVIVKVKNSEYADFFEEVTGVNLKDLSKSNLEIAYIEVAEAIAAYESSAEVNPFSSKYDAYVAGEATFTPEEENGRLLFNGERAKCSQCHTGGNMEANELFTDYTYDNLGTPKNLDNPFYDLPKTFNPAGANFIDYGLGGILKADDEMGKFKVPTLRNIEVTSPYMHNGVFDDLTEVVNFYNTRDDPNANWPAPEVAQNVNEDELGNLGLTDEEVDAIVAFLNTLTDGYEPAET